MKDVWIIGDNFLKSIYHTFMGLKNEAKQLGKPMPYLFNQYNVSAYWVGGTSSGIMCAVRRIINSLINAINKNAHLPRFIIFMAEIGGVVKFMQFYEYGTSKIFGRNINSMINEITRTIEGKKEDMRNKRGGSICYSEPKMIWIKIWDRPSSDKVYTLREKFNWVLEETLTNYKNCYIMDCNEIISGAHFDRANNFNNTGRHALWRFIDQQMKKFDKQEISLRPSKVVSDAKSKSSGTKNNKFLLPRPPPRK